MKLLKNILLSFGLLVVVSAAVLWVLAKSVNPELIKNFINAQLTALTNQQSRIEGDISWYVLPRPGIKITGIQIGDETQNTAYSLHLNNLLFNLKITPLLRGDMVFNELKVDGFKVHINPDVQIPLPASKASSTTATHSNSVMKKFAIERFLLTHGQIIVDHNQQQVVIANLQLGAERLSLKKIPFPLQLKALLTINDNGQTKIKSLINFNGMACLSENLFVNPLIALQNMPADGQLTLIDTLLNKLKINKITAHVQTRPGLLLINPLVISLYDGKSIGDLSYEFASNKLAFNQTATNLNGNKLFSDLVNNGLVNGKLDFSIHTQLNLQGHNWLQSIVGNGNLTIKDGIIQSIDLNKIIDETSKQINALITNHKLEIKPTLNFSYFNGFNSFKGNTAFQLLALQYRLQDGKFHTDSLVLQTDRLQLKGEGDLNLVDLSLDNRLQVKATLLDVEVDKIQQLLGGSFPILVRGTLNHPIVLPDLQIINSIMARLWLKSSLAKPVKQIEKKLKTFFH